MTAVRAGSRLRAALPLRFVLRRIAGTVVVLFVLSVAVFALLQASPVIPRRPCSVRAARRPRRCPPCGPATTSTVHWPRSTGTGSATPSGSTWARPSVPVSVASAIGGRLVLTGQLVGLGLFVALLLGIPLGVLAGLRNRRPADRAVQSLGLIALSTPAFASGLLLIYVFSLMLGWFPAYGPGEGTGPDRLAHLVLPALALGLAVTAVLLKLTRAAVVRELEREHVTFARARGVRERDILLQYVLRGTLVPVLTGVSLVVAFLLAGTVMVEQVFALPGLGSLLVDSVTFRDVPVVQAEALLLAALVCLTGLATDLAHPCSTPGSRTRRPAGSAAGLRRPQGGGPMSTRTHRFTRVSPLVLCSGALVALLVLAASVGQLLLPGWDTQDLATGVAMPGGGHLLGTDELGRDVAQMVVAGARSTLAGAALVAAGSMVIGNVLGLAAGYHGGWTDTLVRRWADLLLALPALLVTIVVAGIGGGGYALAVGVLVILTSPTDIRLVRSAVLEQRHRAYVEAAETLGLSRLTVMARHIWPNVLPVALANALLNFAGAIVALSSLSFSGWASRPALPTGAGCSPRTARCCTTTRPPHWHPPCSSSWRQWCSTSSATGCSRRSPTVGGPDDSESGSRSHRARRIRGVR
ncbi:ABC transporter permease subunit [Streptomyces sp. M10(2022)]